MTPEEIQFKFALTEMASWENQLTKKERADIPFLEAKNRVIERTYKKYKNKIIK